MTVAARWMDPAVRRWPAWRPGEETGAGGGGDGEPGPVEGEVVQQCAERFGDRYGVAVGVDLQGGLAGGVAGDGGEGKGGNAVEGLSEEQHDHGRGAGSGAGGVGVEAETQQVEALLVADQRAVAGDAVGDLEARGVAGVDSPHEEGAHRRAGGERDDPPRVEVALAAGAGCAVVVGSEPTEELSGDAECWVA